MKKVKTIFALALAFLLVVPLVRLANAQLFGSASRKPMVVQEEDGTPTGRPRTLKVSNASLTDNGDGTFSLAGGSGAANITNTNGGISVAGDLSTTGDLSARGDLTVEGLIYVGLQGAIRDTNDGDIEWSDDKGQSWTDFGGGGAEVNNLETITTGIATTEIPIGTAADTVVYAALSSHASMANNGAVTVVDWALTADADAGNFDLDSLDRIEFLDAGLFIDGGTDGVLLISSDGTGEIATADWAISTTGAITNATIEGEGGVLSTGEGGGTKFLREDGDGTSSWQAAAGAGQWDDDGNYLIPSDAMEDVHIDGSLTISEDLTVMRDLTVNQSLTVIDTVYADTYSTVTGVGNYLAITGGLNISLDCSVIGDLSVKGDLTATGTTAVGVTTLSKAASYTLLRQECYGTVLYVTGAATITLPVMAAGMSLTVVTIGTIAVSVDTNGADDMYLDGTLIGVGEKATNTSTTGDIIVLTYCTADAWYGTSNSWTDGGA